MTDEELSKNAVTYFRDNESSLVKRYGDPFVYTPILNPVSYFMSGSPGAGKTEVATRLIEELQAKGEKLLHIDTDEFRKFFPGYNGKNSDLFQNAASMCVQTLFSSAIKNYQSFILDTNFAIYPIALKNIEICLSQNREITIIYIYQEPISAWENTKSREIIEGRRVTKEKFIERFISAKQTTNAIKKKFTNQIQLDVFINDPKDRKKQLVYNDVDNIDKYVKKSYTKEELDKIIK